MTAATKHTPGPTYDLTTIDVQGDDQEAFEVYADDSKEQTIGFVFSEDDVWRLATAPEMLDALRDLVDLYRGGFLTGADDAVVRSMRTADAVIAKAERRS